MPHDLLQSPSVSYQYSYTNFKKKDGGIIPHSHQNLTSLRSDVDYSRFIGNDTTEELLISLLGQLNF